MYTNDCQKIFHMLICIYLLNIFWNCLSFVFWVALIAWWAPVLYFPSKSQILSTSIYFKNKVLFVSSIYLLTTTCIIEPNPISCTHKNWKVRHLSPIFKSYVFGNWIYEVNRQLRAMISVGVCALYWATYNYHYDIIFLASTQFLYFFLWDVRMNANSFPLLGR
jgi:hypothetical protein